MWNVYINLQENDSWLKSLGLDVLEESSQESDISDFNNNVITGLIDIVDSSVATEVHRDDVQQSVPYVRLLIRQQFRRDSNVPFVKKVTV